MKRLNREIGMKRLFLFILLATGATALAAAALSNRINVTEETAQRCIQANGLPDHATGDFPNAGNPHGIQAQQVNICLPSLPEKGDTAQPVRVTGIAVNGVQIRPGTADYFDADSARGHSRNPSSGWNLDGIGAREALGLDDQNAHVGPRGEYHYHGVPPALVSTSESTLIGWAADGFEIHYTGDTARPSYRLKSGERQTEPGGAYDGTYNEDFEYIRGLGNLDECNGATVNGQYVYFATDAYPFYPRCLFGTEIVAIR
ncbi:MAG: YHYH protein [Pseudomonadota bacterium]